MKKSVASFLALLLCISMFLAVIPCVSAATGDEIRTPKKIISVVYDDSGSMKGDRWVYTNYAMQALIALLNEQDELYITFMSDYGTSRAISLADLDAAVEGIRKWSSSSGTPGEALNTAKRKLDSISCSDPSAQYWLMIMTDGEISGISLQSELNSYKNAKMPNGSRLNVAYLAMGSGAKKASKDVKNGLYTFEADSNSNITSVMSDVANLVSSRMNADNVKQVDDKTISFHSSLPLYSISVLAQQSSAKVVSATSVEETLNINRNIALNAHDPFGNTSMRLFGNAAVINLQGSGGVSRVIQSGTYTITFSEPVDVSKLLVQYEPAIGLKMVVTRDGVEVDSSSGLKKDDKVDIELVPVIPGTDQRISDSDLPKDISWQIEYIVGSNVEDSKSARTLNGVKLIPGDNTVRGTMELPGFAPSVFEIFFPVEDFVYDPGIITEQPDTIVFSRTGNDEDGKSDDLIFRITNEGVILNKDELKDMDLKLEVLSVECDNSKIEGFFNRFGNVLSGCSLKQNDDGSYTLTPKPVIPFTAFLTMAGDYTVTVGISGDSSIAATGTFTLVALESDWIELVKLVVSLLFLLYLIYIIFIKHKFKGQTVYYQAYKLSSDGRGIKLANDAGTRYLSPWKNLFSLKRASETEYQGLVLRAGPHGTVIITGKSIAKKVERYKDTSMNPQTQLRFIVSSMQSTKRKNGKKEERFASDQALTKERPVYFRTYDTDTIIWSLKLM